MIVYAFSHASDEPGALGSQTEDPILDGREALSGIAEVAVALAGFSGLFAAFRRGRGEQFVESERQALLFMLTASLGAAVISLAPVPLLLFGISESIVWLIACLSLGIFLASANIWAIRSGRTLTRVPKLFWTLVSFSWGFTVLQFLGVAGLFELPRSAVFAAGLWWLIFGAAIQFLIQAVAATRS
jgi:hypothetical protein